MSTRSGIALKLDNGTYIWNYIHWDGYPAGVGHTLLDNYPTRERVEKLLDLGNLSSLGPIPCDAGDEWRETFLGYRPGEDGVTGDIRYRIFSDNPYCKAYGEPSETVKDYATLRRRFMKSDREYLYVFDERGWRVLSKWGDYGATRLTALKPVVERNQKAIEQYRAKAA